MSEPERAMAFQQLAAGVGAAPGGRERRTRSSCLGGQFQANPDEMNMANHCFHEPVCDRMKKPTIPARKPSAGARPGR